MEQYGPFGGLDNRNYVEFGNSEKRFILRFGNEDKAISNRYDVNIYLDVLYKHTIISK